MLLALESLIAAPSALIWACCPLTFASARAAGRAFLPRPKGWRTKSAILAAPASTTTATIKAIVILAAFFISGVMSGLL